MLPSSARAFRALCLLLLGALLAGGSLRAELVWSPGTGWRIEGGVLSGLIGDDARKATELVNKARLSEERGDLGSAAKA